MCPSDEKPSPTHTLRSLGFPAPIISEAVRAKSLGLTTLTPGDTLGDTIQSTLRAHAPKPTGWQRLLRWLKF
jgi:hypothetical protein